jgi:hypothetical protein
MQRLMQKRGTNLAQTGLSEIRVELERHFYAVTSSITVASTPSSTVTNPTVTGSENRFGPALPGLK